MSDLIDGSLVHCRRSPSLQEQGFLVSIKMYTFKYSDLPSPKFHSGEHHNRGLVGGLG